MKLMDRRGFVKGLLGGLACVVAASGLYPEFVPKDKSVLTVDEEGNAWLSVSSIQVDEKGDVKVREISSKGAKGHYAGRCMK